jgi:hypothetical protein
MVDVTTESGRWDAFPDQILDFLRQDVTDLVVNGQDVRGYRSPDNPALWIRDHSDIMRGGQYVLDDVTSAVTAFADAQAANGRIYDFVTTASESGEPENWEKWVRIPVEADVEYRFVKAAYLAWQATGDDAWVADVLPALDRALTYTCTHPQRWHEESGLVRRPYTIDTWDFDYTAGRGEGLNFQVTDETFWGLFHGDNSGVYEAARLLAHLHRATGRTERAAVWEAKADTLRQRANERLFNGRFYTHFDALTPVSIEGVDESEQLSLSNPMAINRGLATHDIAVSILDEYRRRRETTEAFAEWFSIDPPFPPSTFGSEKLTPGTYVNGGIMPLVGGELARAAFGHGYETYGTDTLAQYRDRIAETGETYLWYFPDGSPSTQEASTSPDAMPTDGWGASAMLYAFVEGLCGVNDRGHSLNRIELAPRWVASGEERAEVAVSYAASGAAVGYRYRHRPGRQCIDLEVTEGRAETDLHVLLPKGTTPTSLTRNGQPVEHESTVVEGSPYADATVHVESGTVLRVEYATPP